MSASGVLWLVCADVDEGSPRFHSMRATVAMGVLLDAVDRVGAVADAQGVSGLGQGVQHPRESDAVEDAVTGWGVERLVGFGHDSITWAGALGLVTDEAWGRCASEAGRQGLAEPVGRGLLRRSRRWRPLREVREREVARLRTVLDSGRLTSAEDDRVMVALAATGAADHALSSGILPVRGMHERVRAALGVEDRVLAGDIAAQTRLAYTGWFPGGVMSVPSSGD